MDHVGQLLHPDLAGRAGAEVVEDLELDRRQVMLAPQLVLERGVDSGAAQWGGGGIVSTPGGASAHTRRTRHGAGSRRTAPAARGSWARAARGRRRAPG